MVDQPKENIVSVITQSKTTKLILINGLLFCGLGTIWVCTKIPIPEIVWFTVIVGAPLIINLFGQLIILYFFSPQSIIINNDIITFNVLFHRKTVIKATDIQKIENSIFLDLLLTHTGWLICSNGKHKYVINKKFFNDYDTLIDMIERYNPKCPIDEGLGR